MRFSKKCCDIFPLQNVNTYVELVPEFKEILEYKLISENDLEEGCMPSGI